MTHELHIAGSPTRSFMQLNLQGDTKLRQVKFQLGCLHLPPLNPDPMAAKARRVGCLIMGKAATVGPADGQRGRFHFFTIWMTSSSSNVWSLPTFWGLCFTDRPQTRALYGREKKKKVSVNNHLASTLAMWVLPFCLDLAFHLLRTIGLQHPLSPIKDHIQSP